MHLRITADSNERTRIGEFVVRISGPIRKIFLTKSYGSCINGIVIVLMCRDREFKQRIRYSKTEKILYVDIMLEYKSYTKDDYPSVIEQISIQLVKIIGQHRSIKNFDVQQLIIDLKMSFEESLQSAQQVDKPETVS